MPDRRANKKVIDRKGRVKKRRQFGIKEDIRVGCERETREGTKIGEKRRTRA